MNGIMKNKFFFICLTTILLGCKSSFEYTHTQKKQILNAYQGEFRLTYFEQLLKHGADTPAIVKRFLATDYSHYGEPLLSKQDRRIIDSLVEADVKKIQKDALDRIGRTAEGTQGKHLMSYALHQYESNWLRKLVKKRTKLFWKQFSSVE